MGKNLKYIFCNIFFDIMEKIILSFIKENHYGFYFELYPKHGIQIEKEFETFKIYLLENKNSHMCMLKNMKHHNCDL